MNTPTDMKKIVVTQPVHPEVLARLQTQGRVVMNPGPEPWGLELLHQHLGDADALMAFMPDRVDARTLRHAPRLRTVACALKGHDNFDLVACAQAGVQVSFVPDLLTAPTAELALGLAIAAARHVLVGNHRMREQGYHGWRPTLYGSGLQGATVAVVGLGAVGRAIVDRLAGFGCAQVLGYDPQAHDARVAPVTLDEAFARADYVFLAVPLLPQTRHIVNSHLLARARPGLVLVNVGRGSVVDEAAVVAALESGHLAAYAADVYEMEDWALPDRPTQVHEGLLRSPRTVLTPHLGSAVRSVRLAIEQQAAEHLIAGLHGVLAEALRPLPNPVKL